MGHNARSPIDSLVSAAARSENRVQLKFEANPTSSLKISISAAIACNLNLEQTYLEVNEFKRQNLSRSCYLECIASE